MTFFEKINYYLPELLQSLQDTCIMLGFSMIITLLIGLPLVIALFLSNPCINIFIIFHYFKSLISFKFRDRFWSISIDIPFKYCKYCYFFKTSRASFIRYTDRNESFILVARCNKIKIYMEYSFS